MRLCGDFCCVAPSFAKVSLPFLTSVSSYEGGCGFEVDDLLSNRYHNYSLDDLTEEVNCRLSEMYPDTNGVVRRTIEKDIFYLEYEGPFLVDIERYTVDAYTS